MGESSSSSSSSATPKKPYGKKDWKKEGTFLHTILPIKFHTATSANLFPISLLMGRSRDIKESINVEALLDTGCLAGIL